MLVFFLYRFCPEIKEIILSGSLVKIKIHFDVWLCLNIGTVTPNCFHFFRARKVICFRFINYFFLPVVWCDLNTLSGEIYTMVTHIVFVLMFVFMPMRSNSLFCLTSIYQNISSLFS